MGSQAHNRNFTEDTVKSPEAGGLVVRVTPPVHPPCGHFCFLSHRSAMPSSGSTWKGEKSVCLNFKGLISTINDLLEENRFQCLLCPCSVILDCDVFWFEMIPWFKHLVVAHIILDQ